MMRRSILGILVFAAACSSSPTPTTSAIAYGDTSAPERLDLYLPTGSGPFPLVIMIHGGAFAFGGRDDAGPGFKADIDALKADGIAVASIDYRLSGETRFPAAVQDVKAAIRFLRGHATAHRIDPDRIAIWGKSAGANLALLGGLARSGFGDPRLGNASVDDRVSAIVAFYPPVDFGSMDRQLKARGCAQGSGSFDGPHDAPGSPESTYLGGALPELPRRGALANPANYVTADAPPVYLTAGTADCTVPADQSVLLFNRLRTTAPQSGSRLFLVEGAKHADPVFDEGDSLARVRAFLRTHLRP